MIIDFGVGFWILFLHPTWESSLNCSWGQSLLLCEHRWPVEAITLQLSTEAIKGSVFLSINNGLGTYYSNYSWCELDATFPLHRDARVPLELEVQLQLSFNSRKWLFLFLNVYFILWSYMLVFFFLFLWWFVLVWFYFILKKTVQN